MNDDPTDYERFTSDATKRAQLKALLADPVLQEAMEIADDLMRPKCNTPADGNQPIAIAKFHQSAGVNQFLTKLRDMTRVQKELVKPAIKKFAKTAADLPPISQ